MAFVCRKMALAVAIACCSMNSFSADTAFVYYAAAESALNGNINTNLAARLTTAGYATTSSADTTALPGSLAGYKQVWDIHGSAALTNPQQTTYLSYLQGGGTLFLMGENSGYGAARNASLVSFITLAGGGTVQTGASGNSQTVQGTLATTPNTQPTITYAAVGGYLSQGSGICLTKDNNNVCGAVAWRGGSLANAPSGALVSVLDINFLDDRFIVPNFVDNLIAYMAIAKQPLAVFVPVSNPTTGGVGATLDGLLTASSINANMAATVGALGSLNDTQRALAMNRLVPSPNNSLSRLGMSGMAAGLTSISARIEQNRTAGLLAWSSSSAENMMLAANGNLSGLLERKELKHGAWGKIIGNNLRQDASGTYAGYEANTWGMTFGADARLEQGTLVGGAFTYAKTDLNQQDYLAGSGNNSQNFQISGYASHDFGEWYLDAILSYGEQRYKSHRDTGVTGVASANYTGSIWGTKVTAGLPIAISDKTTLTPFASVEYSSIRQNSYTESGAGVLNLSVKGTTAERFRSGLGVRVTGETTVSGTLIRPTLHAQWLHEYRNDGVATTAGFSGGGVAFVTPGQSLPRNTGNVGGSLLFAAGKNAALSVHYDYEGSNGYRNQTGQIIGQWWF